MQDTSADDPRTKTQITEEFKAAEAVAAGAEADPRKQEEFEWENYVESMYKPPVQSAFDNNDEIMNYENLISTTATLFAQRIPHFAPFG